MDFQVVVLAGGNSDSLVPLVSKDLPKALLPVASRPVLSFVLDLLEASGLRDVIVAVEGEEAAVLISAWIQSVYSDRLLIKVVTVPDEVGSVGSLRAISDRLTAGDVIIVSGDLVTDVHPGALAAMHRRHGAAITALLCPVPVSGPSEVPPSGSKDKARKPTRYNIVGLDVTRQFLLHIASGTEVDKDIRVLKSILRAGGQMEIRADLMDAHMYAFNRSVLLDLLEKNTGFHSVSHDLLSYLVKNQLRSVTSPTAESEAKETSNGAVWQHESLEWFSRYQEVAPSAIQQLAFSSPGAKLRNQNTHKCCVYIAPKSKYCARLNSIQAFSDINRDVVGDASHLSGYSFSAQNNIIHPTSVLGTKTTVGPQSMLDEGSQLGDKCSVKRSVIGRHCRIGSNVKIVNSVVMNHVVIEDGCSIQGSVVCSNAQLQERAVLKDCQVGAGYIVTAGSEHKLDSLSKA